MNDEVAQRALFAVLTAHSNRGADTMCTAYLGRYLGSQPHPVPGGEDAWSNVQRGPLGAAWSELYEQCQFVAPPQNLWPDDHSWVLETDLDGYMTAVSGTASLAEDLLACTALETFRLPHLQ